MKQETDDVLAKKDELLKAKAETDKIVAEAVNTKKSLEDKMNKIKIELDDLKIKVAATEGERD